MYVCVWKSLCLYGVTHQRRKREREEKAFSPPIICFASCLPSTSSHHHHFLLLLLPCDYPSIYPSINLSIAIYNLVCYIIMPTPRAAEAALRNSSPVANRVNLSNLAIIDLSATSNVHRTASTLRKVQYITPHHHRITVIRVS